MYSNGNSISDPVASLGSLCTGCMLYDNCEWMHKPNESLLSSDIIMLYM